MSETQRERTGFSSQLSLGRSWRWWCRRRRGGGITQISAKICCWRSRGTVGLQVVHGVCSAMEKQPIQEALTAPKGADGTPDYLTQDEG